MWMSLELALKLLELSTWLMLGKEGREEWRRGRRVELTSSPLLKKAFVPRAFSTGFGGVSLLRGTLAGSETAPTPVENL